MSVAVRPRPLLGVAMVLVSAVCYATLPALAKVSYEHGADTLGVLALRFAIAAPVLLIYMALRRRGTDLRRAARLLAIPAVIYFFQTLTFFESLSRMSAVIAVLTLFSYPLMVAAGGALFLGERLDAKGVGLIALGSAGVALSVGLGGKPDGIGIALALGSAVMFAAYFLIAKNILSTTSLDGVTLTALTYVLAAVGYPALMLAAGGSVPADAEGWIAVTTLSVVGTVIGAVLLFQGLHHLTAGTASMLSGAEPPVAVGLAALLLSEPVVASQIAGMLVVVVALTALSYRETRPAADVPPMP